MPFQKATCRQAYLKAGIYGPTGAGKTMTSLMVAEGLATTMKKRVAMVDTEFGADFYSQEIAERGVHPAAFDFDALHSKQIMQVLADVKSLDFNEYGVVIIDSVTHLWEAAIAAYSGKKTRAGTIPLNAWGAIKKPYKELINFLMSAPVHMILCGRQGEKYEEVDGGELKSTGKKMNAEKDTSYEPHIMIRLESIQTTQGITQVHAIVEKDRTGILAGRQIINPGFDTIARPILKYLGLEQAQIESDEEAARKDAEAQAAAEQAKMARSQTLYDDFVHKVKVAKSQEDLDAIGKEIGKAKGGMTNHHVADLRARWQERKDGVVTNGELQYVDEAAE